MPEEKRERIDFNFHQTLTPLAPVLLVIIAPLALVGLFVFGTYVATHFQTFIGQSASIVSWVLLFLAACLYVALAYCAVRVLLLFGRGIVEIYHRFVDARATVHRRSLLHVADNYVVYTESGRIVVEPVTQEKHIHHTKEVTAPGQTTIAEQGEMDELPAPVQSFYDLLAAGVIQSALEQGKMLLGYIGGQLRYGSWLDLYSCGIGGVSGSGKTTTVRFLLFQAILAGAQLLMIDPHINEPEESLAAQFRAFPAVHVAAPCDDTPAAVLKRIRWFDKERQRRKVAGIKSPALIFVIDEFNALMRVEEIKKEMSALLLSISQEGRKFGLFAMLIGQRWSDQDMGGANMGAAIRSSLASTLAHRFTDETQAKKLVGGKHGAECLELPQGHYLFRDTQGMIAEMITPYTTIEDGEVIQELLEARQAAENTPENRYHTPENSRKIAGKLYEQIAFSSERQGVRNLLESGLKTGRKEPDTEQIDARQDALQEKMQIVMRLQAEGKNKPDIIRAVWNVSPGGSQAYEQANTEYQAIMRRVFEQIR